VAVHATGARSCLGLQLAVPVGTPSLAVVAAVVVAITVLSSTLFKSWDRRESPATSAPVQDEAVQAVWG
jgi:hypothetical protein